MLVRYRITITKSMTQLNIQNEFVLKIHGVKTTFLRRNITHAKQGKGRDRNKDLPILRDTDLRIRLRDYPSARVKPVTVAEYARELPAALSNREREYHTGCYWTFE